VAGLEGKPVRNLFFAGEHTNSSYVFQGFMEGAALSGLDAAAAILRIARRSRASGRIPRQDHRSAA
jgi:monoamine oxidase